MGLTRKKVRVKAKSGKTYTRNMMVKSSAPNKRGGVASLKPWEPGSSHSGIAVLAGHVRGRDQFYHGSDPAAAASFRRATGMSAIHRATVDTKFQVPKQGSLLRFLNQGVGRNISEGFRLAEQRSHDWNQETRVDLFARHGRENVHEVHQDPRKWVR